MKRLYVECGYTLRRIADIFHTNHHYVKRRLQEMGVEITRVGRHRKPLDDVSKQNMSRAAKNRRYNKPRGPQSLLQRYKNMRAHLHWDVPLEFLMQFDDIDRLRYLNKVITRDRVAPYFDAEEYKAFIERFFRDEQFNRQYDIWQQTGHPLDQPSLDHIIPLSRGGTWELDNLQFISWFENRAKCNLLPEEYEQFKRRYWANQTES